MKILKTFMLLSVLVICFSTSLSWGNYNGFPMDDPEVTGKFMEYRTGHFHGGIDMISRQSNNIVRPVAEGDLFYTYDDSSETYSIWIDHDTGKYANLATRYLHIGKYPGAKLHVPGVSRPVTTSDTLGTIVTPHDGYGDHLHFEVRDGNDPSDADYLNPLSKLPEIADDVIDYSADWTWTIIDDEGYYADVDASTGLAEGFPLGSVRLLFKGFDRIKNPTTDRYLGFYSITARFLKNSEINGIATTDTLLKWTFTADQLPVELGRKPHYLFNDDKSVNSGDGHESTKSQFYYRLFAHDDANQLSITVQDSLGYVPDPWLLDEEGYIDGEAYGISDDHWFEVVVADYEGNPSTQQLFLPATAIGDRFEDFNASSGTRQVTLSWSSDRGAGYWSHFKIQRSQDSGISYTTLDSVAYDPTSSSGEYSYVDNTATDDIAYYYRVFTDELYGPVWARPFSGYSTPVPGTPVISIGDTGAGYFGLSIDTGATYADGYQVEYGLVGQSFPWSATITGTPTETVYDDSLTAGTYEVRVRGYNNAGKGGYSNTAKFTLETPLKPATPTGTVHTSRPGADRGWVLMKWAANTEPDIVGYKVYCFDGTGYQPVADVSGTSWSSLGADIWPTDAEIADGRYALHADGSGVDLKNDPHLVYTNSPSSTYNDSISYWFAVKAKNRLGNLSELSEPWRAMLPGASGRLQADETWAGSVRVAGDITVPAGVRLTVAANTVVQFLANRDDTGGGTDAGRSELIVHGTLDASAGGITFRSVNDSPTTAEWYGIRVASGGRADLSNASLHDGVRCVSNEGALMLTLDNTMFDACGMEPSAPQNLMATPGSGAVTLAWEAPADNGGVALSGYEYSTDNSIWTGDATSPLTLDGLTNGTEYTFWVRAVNVAGIEGVSAMTTATPQASIMGRATVRFAENGTDTVAVYTSPQAGVRWSLTGTDADSLTIDGSGQLRFRSPPNFEAPADADTDNVYAVSVVARDGTVADTLDVTITVSNAEEAGTLVLSPLPPQVDVPLQVALSDADGQVRDVEWEWWRQWPPWQGWRFSQKPPPYTPSQWREAGYQLQVRVSYRDGHGTARDTLVSAWTDSVRTNVPQAPQQPKAVPLSASSVVLSWDAPPSHGGSAIGHYEYRQRAGTEAWSAWSAPVAGGGSARGDTVAGLQGNTRYSFAVRAVNAKGAGAASDSVWVLTPAGVDQPPVLAGALAPSVVEHDTTWVGPYTARDPNGDAITWLALTGEDAGSFDLTGTTTDTVRTLVFKARPDYEQQSSYGVSLRVQSGSPALLDTLDVSVSVTNVEEVGRVSVPSSAPQVGVSLPALLEDADGGGAGAGLAVAASVECVVGVAGGRFGQ